MKKKTTKNIKSILSSLLESVLNGLLFIGSLWLMDYTFNKNPLIFGISMLIFAGVLIYITKHHKKKRKQ